MVIRDHKPAHVSVGPNGAPNTSVQANGMPMGNNLRTSHSSAPNATPNSPSTPAATVIRRRVRKCKLRRVPASFKRCGGAPAAAVGDGSAATNDKDGTAVGIGIAINVAFMDNNAILGAGTTVTADGFRAEALMRDVSGDTTHKFGATAISGASGGETGVAGSFALSYAKTETNAVVGDAAGAPGNMTLTGGDVSIAAETTSASDVTATSKTAGSSKTGVGLSFGINILLEDTVAEVVNGTQMSVSAGDFKVSAESENAATTKAEAGAQGGSGTNGGGAI